MRWARASSPPGHVRSMAGCPEQGATPSGADLKEVTIRVDKVHAAVTSERIVPATVHSILGIIAEGYRSLAEPGHDLVERLRVHPERQVVRNTAESAGVKSSMASASSRRLLSSPSGPSGAASMPSKAPRNRAAASGLRTGMAT